MMKRKSWSIYFRFLFVFVVLFCNGKALLSADDFYWEDPSVITSGDTRFPKVITNGVDTYVFYQSVDEKKHQIFISGKRNKESLVWEDLGIIAGPFPYSGDVPDMYSAAVSSSGTIAVAVLSDTKTISIFTSKDFGKSFTQTKLSGRNEPFVAPRLYCTSTGSFMLFVALGKNESFSMLYALSPDGYIWPSFSDFSPAKKLLNPFVPVLCPMQGTDIVVFQAQYNNGSRFSYQLYSTVSTDNCLSWTDPVLVTGEKSLIAGVPSEFSSYQNQRPDLYAFKDKVYLSWERTYYTSENATIWVAALTPSGTPDGQVERITSSGNANRPILFSYKGILSLVWFDTRRGIETVYFSQKNGYLWNETALSSGKNAALFAYPALTDAGNMLSFFWESTSAKNGNYRICLLAPDKSAAPPSFEPLSFKGKKRSTAEKVSVRIGLPQDPSGIAGFSWIWTQNKDEEPPEKFMNLPSEHTITVQADSDGEWYLKARVVDYAGNWSKSSSISYFRDTTPPHTPIINPYQTDRFGFSNSNTFNITWNPDSHDDDIAGYTWSLNYVAPIAQNLTETKRHPIKLTDDQVSLSLTDFMTRNEKPLESIPVPPRTLLGRKPQASYYNHRNGLYIFSVAAIDTVGNVGKPAVIQVILNKYVPSTYIVSVSTKKNIFGDLVLSIIGSGFTYDGTISKIYIDRDGKAPYDLILRRSANQFHVTSDNRIDDIKIGNEIRAGTYRIGLLHPERGLYLSSPRLVVTETGTVKLQRHYDFEPDWQPVTEHRRWHIEIGDLLLWIISSLALLGIFYTTYGLVRVAKDSAVARLEARALLTGDIMPLEKKKQTAALTRRGTSLKVKLILFTTGLVLMVILFVSVPLEMLMTQTQERTLSKGLQERVNVLLESLASGVHAYMPSKNLLELSFLPSQTSALQEAEYATITGFSSGGKNTRLDYIWATNDSEITEKIDTQKLVYGESRLNTDIVAKIVDKCNSLNAEATEQVGDIAANITELNTEGISLALKTDEKSVKRREEISTVTTELNTRLSAILNDISLKGGGSYPQYNTDRLDRTTTKYLFYKPVLYRQGTEQNYVRAIVFIEISTDNLIKSVDVARRTILITAAIVALVAIVIGVLGSLFVATIIVKPIRRLASHVAMIGETIDKEKLAGKDIVITSNDEIGQLGETVNEMTHGLVKAAQDEHLLMDGKVVQQTFLPLDVDSHGHKETTAQFKDKRIHCFGYYEGASGVSGDYFDYKKLDDRWYVIIKCDASGHGVPAALIMTVVATLFRRYFDSWSFKKEGTNLNSLVVQINDFIESLGIKGKFATIILCLLDTETGDVYMCNAGDNIVHIYDKTQKKQKTITLSETPAAGPLPSFMVNMKGGFKVEKYHINPGDVLFLYTDGIEEATRKFRDTKFLAMKCSEIGLAEGADHGNHKVGDSTEQLESERVGAVIESVFSREVYRLEKYHNPVPGEILEFDFTTCQGTIEDAILALASVEKVFRMYKSPDVTENDVVQVDKKIDAFLEQHFNLYTTYCLHKKDIATDNSYLYYTYLREDDQLDDLTLVAVTHV